jgi:aspartyl-tRNA(Asn)/glutamyl-tRNA(Gln) amidotransferase subunit C
MKKSDIEHIARLAKLELTEQEMEKFAVDLTPVLKYVDQLKELQTDDLEPLITASDIEYWMREDKVERISTTEDAVANAPERAGNLYKVPPVV